MTKQLNANNTAASFNASAFAAASRFNAQSIGLSEAQLKSIAGARPCEKTCTVTSAPVTRCCW